MKIIPAYPKTKKSTMHLTADAVHHITMHLTTDGTAYIWQDRKWDLYEKKLATRKKAIKAPAVTKKSTTPITAAQVQEIVADMRRCGGWSTNVKSTSAKSTSAKSTPAATYPDLVKRYNTLASDPDSDPTAYQKTLIDLATATAYCVVKKCVDPARKGDPEKASNSGYSPAMVKIRRDITADRKTTDNINRLASSLTYHIEYNKNGDPVSVCDDPDSEQALSNLIHSTTINDGYDLVNDCIAAILTECEKQKDRDPEKPIDFERPYTVNRLKKKVYIKKADSVGGYETVTTTPIQEVFKAVRRCIENSRTIQTDPKNGYSYIEDLTTSPDGDPDTIYYRLPKYSDLGGHVKDFNGKDTTYTTDSATVENTENLIEKLNLTTRQAAILQLRLKGYGYKAISTYLGISADNVKGQIKEIRRKAAKIGLTPEKTPAK